MPALGSKLIPALMVVGLAATAGAQQQSACQIDDGTPSEVAKAMLDVQLSQGNAKPEDAAKKLQDAVKQLTSGDKSKNPVGRAFVLGKALTAFSMEPAMASGMTTRGAVGFQDNPTAAYDLYAGIDSSFKVVEASNPDCLSQTVVFRQQKPWVDFVNHSIELVNADKTDSAVALAKKSLVLSTHAPYAYMVLAQAAQKANQPKEVISYYKQAIDAANYAATKDTAMAETRRQLQAQLGNFAADAAESATGADKTELLAEAKAAYGALAKDPGTKYADAAQQGQARLAQLSGDTAAIKATYSAQLANPSAFNYNQLMTAAVTAARTNQTKDAIKLFEAAKAVNPSHRDVLYNLARLYLLDSSYTKGIETARQLVAVDPDNSDNYQLLAIGYAALQKGYQTQQRGYDSTAKALGKIANTSKSAKAVKAAIDSAGKINKFITIYGDSAKTMVDSAIKYNTFGTTLPGKVSFTEFAPTDAKTSIGGSIANTTDAPKTYDLKIDFVDKTGNVVTSQSVTVGPVAPGQSAPFKAEATGAGIVAFKYSPIAAK